jgi:ABC-type sugar transport system ATPase subunit
MIIMDEPSATLAIAEAENLFRVIEKLRAEGVTVIYISHRMDEVFRLADSLTVLRDGRHISTGPIAGKTRSAIIKDMVGRDVAESYPERCVLPGGQVLRLERITGNGDSDISLTLHKGEILGLAGLVGAGRTELAKLIVGAAKIESGVLEMDGSPVKIRTPDNAAKLGIGIIPENRKAEGVFMAQSVRWNISLMALRRASKFSFVNDGALKVKAAEMRDIFRIKTPSLEQMAGNLSGGNQQKVVLAKVLAADTHIILFDEPTRGIDVGVKQDIYRLMNELVERGVSIIMISSEMEELIGMSDRIIVLYRGKVAGELARAEFDQNRILELACGLGLAETGCTA